MKRKGQEIDRWVIIDKPADMGSTPVVSKVRRCFNAKKAGHAGTLDPFATGILPIALGIATKTIPFIQDADKEYIFTLKFGEMTDTLDSEGSVIETSSVIPNLEDIQAVLPEFMGEIQQIPPAYSAIKINGKRAYDLARQGVDVEIPQRTVTIKALHIIEQKNNDSVVMGVTCSKGTYIRTLGKDIAVRLGSVGYLTALRRTRVGPYGLEDAFSLDKIQDMLHNGTSTDDVSLSVESALVGIPVLTVADERVSKVRNGLAERGSQLNIYSNNQVIVLASKDHILGLGQKIDNQVKPIRIFNNPVPKKGK